MDERTIREVLTNLIERNCGFESFAVTNKPLALKRLDLSEDGDDGGLKEELKRSLLSTINEKYLAEDSSYISASHVADNQNVFYIIEQSDEYEPFRFINQIPEQFQEADIASVYGFMFIFRYGEQSVYCFQKGNITTIPNRRKANFLARFLIGDRSVILEPQDEPVLSISKSIDAIVIDDCIITDNVSLMERSFDFQTFIKEKARSTIQSVIDSSLFSNTELLYKYSERSGGNSKRYCTKLMRVMDSPVLKMDRDELFGKLSTVERWNGKFAEPVDGQIPLRTFKDVDLLVDLLDERFTKSEVTGEEYDTDVKKKVSK